MVTFITNMVVNLSNLPKTDILRRRSAGKPLEQGFITTFGLTSRGFEPTTRLSTLTFPKAVTILMGLVRLNTSNAMVGNLLPITTARMSPFLLHRTVSKPRQVFCRKTDLTFYSHIKFECLQLNHFTSTTGTLISKINCPYPNYSYSLRSDSLDFRL